MKTVTIPIPDSLEPETVEMLKTMLVALASVEWSMLLQFYRAQQFEIHHKGGDVEVTAKVWK